MVSHPAAAAQEQARQADGKFGPQVHAEPHGVVLAAPSHGSHETRQPYNESVDSQPADTSSAGIADDQYDREDEAIGALKQDNAAEPDLSMFFEEDRELPRALYRAGLQGTLEPYNGDYPVEDGALRYWDEDLNRELVVGTTADGTAVVAMDAELSDPVRISVSLGRHPAPEEILAAIRDVSGQVRQADLPDPDDE